MGDRDFLGYGPESNLVDICLDLLGVAQANLRVFNAIARWAPWQQHGRNNQDKAGPLADTSVRVSPAAD